MAQGHSLLLALLRALMPRLKSWSLISHVGVIARPAQTCRTSKSLVS